MTAKELIRDSGIGLDSTGGSNRGTVPTEEPGKRRRRDFLKERFRVRPQRKETELGYLQVKHLRVITHGLSDPERDPSLQVTPGVKTGKILLLVLP